MQRTKVTNRRDLEKEARPKAGCWPYGLQSDRLLDTCEDVPPPLPLHVLAGQNQPQSPREPQRSTAESFDTGHMKTEALYRICDFVNQSEKKINGWPCEDMCSFFQIDKNKGNAGHFYNNVSSLKEAIEQRYFGTLKREGKYPTVNVKFTPRGSFVAFINDLCAWIDRTVKDLQINPTDGSVNVFKTLYLLSDGEYHSAEEMAKHLFIDQTQVKSTIGKARSILKKAKNPSHMNIVSKTGENGQSAYRFDGPLRSAGALPW